MKTRTFKLIKFEDYSDVMNASIVVLLLYAQQHHMGIEYGTPIDQIRFKIIEFNGFKGYMSAVPENQANYRKTDYFI